MKKQISAWAIKVKLKRGGEVTEFFPGEHCWFYGVSTAIGTPLFETRREAREWRRWMNSYRKEARVVRVLVTIDTMDEEESGEACEAGRDKQQKGQRE